MNLRTRVKVGSVVVAGIATVSLVSTHPIVALIIGASAATWFYAEKYL